MAAQQLLRKNNRLAMYLYYQLIGGNEQWSPIQANQQQELDKLKPTFVTVLQIDTLLPEDASREMRDKVKYVGPMYFDLDAADISESIRGSQELLGKLGDLGVLDTDVEIYLSGKKGLHIILPQEVFIAKPVPVVKLPHIYKELAFLLAVETLDFKVYTGGKGRMLRTCYNIRENGNYRVAISAQELRELTPEKYAQFCKAPRAIVKAQPKFSWKMGLEYDKAAAKVPKTVVKKAAPVNAVTLQRHWSDVSAVFNGEGLKADTGFNKIALQMCLYARECGWNVDTLIEKSQGLVANHNSDGSRYNTPWRREQELRRMFDYVLDNPAYDYAVGGLLSLLTQQTAAIGEGGEVVTEVLSSGVKHKGNCYTTTKVDDVETQISNFVFADASTIKDLVEGSIVSITATLKGLTREPVALYPSNFTSSSALQNAVAVYGGSFTGTDAHARGVYQLMLKEISHNKFLVASEGVNLVRISANASPELVGQDVVVWADRYGVQMPKYAEDLGLELVFQGFPDPCGVLRTDLAMAAPVSEYLATNKHTVVSCLSSLFRCHPPETIGKILGWMVACHWKQLFQATYQKFPILHVYGAAGAGKSELTTSLLHLFYYREEPKTLTPAGTTFALQALISGSASIPIVLDEYKPHRMDKTKLETIRATLRDAYNQKSVSRGGGSRTRDSFNALNVVALSAPTAFIAEAVETETAIMERSILVAIKRQSPRAAMEGLRNFLLYRADLTPLSVLGRHLAGWVVAQWNQEMLRAEFDNMHAWAINRFMMQPGDEERRQKGELSQEAYDRKLLGRPRPIFNSTVALFGLVQLRKIVQQAVGADFETELGPLFKAMSNSVYENMEVVNKATMPEFLKVLQTASDITKLKEDAVYSLRENMDYNLAEMGGRQVLVFHVRSVYNKYCAYLRVIGGQPLYPTDTSFEIALRETPQFIGTGSGTRSQPGRVLVMDYEELLRGGMPGWAGKPQVLPEA